MICRRCGEPLETGETLCIACGCPAEMAPAIAEDAMPILILRRHTRIMGILWLIFGVMRIATALLLVIKSGVLALMWGALLNRVPDPQAWMKRFEAGLAVLAVVLIISAVASLGAGLALLSRARIGRILGIVAAFLGFVGGPPAVALAVYTLIILLSPGSRVAYDEVATAA